MQTQRESGFCSDSEIHKRCVSSALAQHEECHEEECADHVEVWVFEEPDECLAASAAEICLAYCARGGEGLALSADCDY